MQMFRMGVFLKTCYIPDIQMFILDLMNVIMDMDKPSFH